LSPATQILIITNILVFFAESTIGGRTLPARRLSVGVKDLAAALRPHQTALISLR